MARLSSHIAAGSAEYSANREVYDRLLKELRERYRWAMAGGGDTLQARHRDRGKLPVRERIDHLVDIDSPFLELSVLAGYGMYDNSTPCAGIVTGIGIVSGTPVMIIANDATVKGGAFFPETVRKHVRAQEIASENRLPCIYLVDCGGAFLPEQDRVFPDWGHFGTAFYNQCRMSADGLPQISAVFGPATAGGAYIPALSDESVMVRGTGRIHLGGPPIVKAAVNEVVDGEALGGAAMQVEVSGVSDYLAETELEALARLREIVAQLRPTEPGYTQRPAQPPLYSVEDIGGILNANPKIPYDVRDILARLLDASAFQEFKPSWGETLVCGFGAIHGNPVGVLANNGVLFSDSSQKGAHFIELCNQRDIPLLFLQNITGFMVGVDAERGGIAKHSAKLVYALSTARVPRYTVIIGGSYGAGNYGMCGRGFAPRFLFTWPNSRIATMSADVAASVLVDLRTQGLRGAELPPGELEALDAEVREQFTRQSDPYYATARLWDDGIVEPADTRDILGLCLSLGERTRRVPQGPSPVYRM